MKYFKLISLSLFLVICIGCEKEYTCTCMDDQTKEVVNVSMYELSKSDAESACNNADAVEGVSCVLDQK